MEYSISGNDDSHIEIEGTLDVENNFESYLLLDISVDVLSSGSLICSFPGIKLVNTITVLGAITIDGFLDFDSSSTFILNGGTVEAHNFFISEFSSISGIGYINSTVFNYGTIEPSSEIEIQNDLILYPSSKLMFSNKESNSQFLRVKGTIIFNGSLSIDFFNHHLNLNDSFTLFYFEKGNAEFSSISINCESLLKLLKLKALFLLLLSQNFQN
ncbi:hypothetical protein GEMRC1_007757 [Eukaryota sp. GEM-RC1]